MKDTKQVLSFILVLYLHFLIVHGFRLRDYSYVPISAREDLANKDVSDSTDQPATYSEIPQEENEFSATLPTTNVSIDTDNIDTDNIDTKNSDTENIDTENSDTENSDTDLLLTTDSSNIELGLYDGQIPTTTEDSTDVFETISEEVTGPVNATSIVTFKKDKKPPSKATFNQNCRCGKKLVASRIVGGEDTEVNEYPWQVALTTTSGFAFCGGSLITNCHILTAAHCVKPFINREIRILLQEHDLQDSTESNLITRTSGRIYVHPKYDSSTNFNDIAIIKMKQCVPISETLLPVCLPGNKKMSYNKKRAIVTGWGTTSSGGFTSNTLKEVEVQVSSPKKCRSNSNYAPASISSRMICAGDPGKDSCQGDSGGPLVWKHPSDSYTQIGVVSWGIGCALERYPGVYTRVNKYLKWIESKTRAGEYCSGFQFP